MRTLVRAVARLYPRQWRARYGSEFDALLEDVPPRWRDVLNILMGACVMHMSRPALPIIVVAVAIVGAMAGAAASSLRTPIYSSSSHVVVRMPGAAPGDPQRAERIRTAIEAALTEAALDKATTAVTLRPQPADPQVLEITASADSAQKARSAAERAVNAVLFGNLQSHERGAAGAGIQLRLLEAPDLPATAHRPILRDSLAGGSLGLIAGIAVVYRAKRRARLANR